MLARTRCGSPLPSAIPSRRRTLTRERVVAEAVTIIGADGVDALSMRALATRLGVVPGALYRHVRNKEQLHDLVLDEVLAEVDNEVDNSLAWTERVKVLAHRLRTVLENHPGIAGLLKTRDPLGPHSLALAEAFLAPLHEAGLPERQTGLAFSLVYDYTLGFALSGPTSVNEQRVRDAATRAKLHAFLQSLAGRPLPSPGRPRRVRLGRQPRRTVHRRPRHARRRTRSGATPTPTWRSRPATATVSVALPERQVVAPTDPTSFRLGAKLSAPAPTHSAPPL